MAKSSANGARKNRTREIFGILVVCLSIFILIALFTFDEADWPGSSREFGNAPVNLAGKYGAFVSYKIFEVIGLTGYALGLFLGILGFVLFLHKPYRMLLKPAVMLSVAGFFLPLIATLSIDIGAENTIPSTGYGGIIGVLSAHLMISSIGRTSAYLLSFASILVAVVLTTNLKPSVIVELIYTSFKNVFGPIFRDALQQLIHSAKSLNSLKKNKSKQTKKTSKAAPEEDYDDYGEEDPFLTPVEEDIPEITIEEPRRMTNEPTIKLQQRELDEIVKIVMTKDDIQNDPDEPDMMNPLEDEVIGGDLEVDSEDGEFEGDEYEDGEEYDGDEDQAEQYTLPPIDLLDEPSDDVVPESREDMLEKAQNIAESLRHFNVEAEVRQITPGPIVTRYELTLKPGIKIGRVVNLSDDLAMALKSKGAIRILAPIPGKAAIGIELPNKARSTVYFREIVESESFQTTDKPLLLALGKNTAGEPVVADLAKMPHLLIAGSTGSGKSVCINTIISSILMKATPEKVRMIMVDPKVVELTVYNSIPHLLTPVITDPKRAADALKWSVEEMERRYRQLATLGTRNIVQYNTKLAAMAAEAEQDDTSGKNVVPPQLPYIVLIIDEFADLMVVASNDIEESIARLAQMARAVGIHLVLATQRPSADVITGLIKANFPSRIAFKVMQASNSRIILDTGGADKLLGLGDMLFLQVSKPEPIRIHGAYISSEESSGIVDFVANQPTLGARAITEDMFRDDDVEDDNILGMRDPNDRDVLFFKAARLVVRSNQGSVSLLQRRLKIGYARAARLIDQLELASIVSPYDGSKAREVMVDDQYIDELEAGEI